jgi:hypothetical protein
MKNEADAQLIMGGRKNSSLNDVATEAGMFDAWASFKEHLTSADFLENLQEIYSSD